MGVPAFFRWLSRKYPSVIIECTEQKSVDPETGKNVYEDASEPNPNGVEFDNLYLDMNGIIHPCTHPEDKPAPKNEDEMMEAIFECMDRLFNIVRPRKVLYLAIDGVAPRAKMNQQRSRRFRSSKEAVEKRLEIERIRSELAAKGCILPPEKEKGESFDSNCITPGTPFMDRLSKCLHYYIHERMNNNPAWKNLKVILSDANVPGEGEHKIMDFIRKQRAQPDHDPNTQHVLCGADADLIMLGLATHEPNFTIIREEFLPNKPRPCEICQQFGHEMDKCIGLNPSDMSVNKDFKPDVQIGAEVRFIFVRLNVLREYLRRTLEMPNLPFKYEFERVIDDWVFMCFFVGNDFLPHLPSLEIREGAVDRLVELYKKCVYKTGGFLTDSGEVNLKRVQMIMNDLGLAEDQIFKERQRREQQFKAREKVKRARENHASLEQSAAFAAVPLGAGQKTPGLIENYKAQAAMVRTGGGNDRKRTAAAAGLDDDEEEEVCNDEVRLWEDGFKDRYYESKFDVSPKNLSFRYSVALQYVRGLCWVLKYYYQGCASWDWYFPYHYAPFASDFLNIDGLSTSFEKTTKPFRPLEQLMGVFPAASSSHIPDAFAQLMHDPDSPIIDFYPDDFKIDLNGKKFAWQGVALLPFVDEMRLFKALEPYYNKLNEEEVRRNMRGDSRLYIGEAHEKFKFLQNQYKLDLSSDTAVPILLDGMSGLVLLAVNNVPLHGSLKSPIAGLPDVVSNKVVTVRFRDPEYNDEYIFQAKRLPNAIDPPTVLGSEQRGPNYKPVIGFNNSLPSAYLDGAGHRMLNAQIGNYNSGSSSSQQQQQGRNNNIPYNYNNNYNNYKNQGNYTNSNNFNKHSSNNFGNNYNNQQQQQQQQSNYNAQRNNYGNRGGPYQHNNNNNMSNRGNYNNNYAQKRGFSNNRGNYRGNRY